MQLIILEWCRNDRATAPHITPHDQPSVDVSDIIRLGNFITEQILKFRKGRGGIKVEQHAHAQQTIDYVCAALYSTNGCECQHWNAPNVKPNV